MTDFIGTPRDAFFGRRMFLAQAIPTVRDLVERTRAAFNKIFEVASRNADLAPERQVTESDITLVNNYSNDLYGDLVSVYDRDPNRAVYSQPASRSLQNTVVDLESMVNGLEQRVSKAEGGIAPPFSNPTPPRDSRTEAPASASVANWIGLGLIVVGAAAATYWFTKHPIVVKFA